MTTVATTANAAITSDATFRAWGAIVSAAFTAAGLVQTADTGQIDWVTVTKPTAADVQAGFEIYRFSDALQATKPVFIRIEYWSDGQSSGNNVGLRLNVGIATNGAGTLTTHTLGASAIVTSTRVVQSGSNTSQIIKMCYSDGNFAALSTQRESSNLTPSFSFVIARTVDSSGAPSGQGLYVWAIGYGAGFDGNSYAMNFDTATSYANSGATNAAPPGDLANYDSGNYSYVLPHYACMPAPVLVAGLLTVRNAAGSGPSAGSVFTCAAQGATSRTYLVWGFDVTGSKATLWGGTSMTGVTYESYWGNIAVVWQ